MATLVATVPSRTGTDPGYESCNGDGDDFVNTGSEVLLVLNQDEVSRNVTIITPGTVDGLPVGDRVVAVPAGAHRLIGPFPKQFYNNPATGKVSITWEDEVFLVALLRLNP